MRAFHLGRWTIIALLCGLSGPLWGHDPQPGDAKPAQVGKRDKGQPLVLDEVMEELSRHPHDSYLQYVALQLARRANDMNVIAAQIRRKLIDHRGAWSQIEIPRGRDELFNFLTPRLHIQQSLQIEFLAGPEPIDADNGRRVVQTPPGLDGLAEQMVEWQKYSFPVQVVGLAPWPATGQWLAMNLALTDPKISLDFLQKSFIEKMHADRLEVLARRRAQQVPFLELAGLNIKSPFWHGKLANQRPAIGLLARSVPEDFYLLEFRSFGKMLEAADQLDGFARYVANQAFLEARAENTLERLQKQLGLTGQAPNAGLLDQMVGEIGLAGSDFFLHEGSDVTLLCRLKQPQAFRLASDLALRNAAKVYEAKVASGKIHDVSYQHLSTPDRSVWVYVADPLPDLHLRTNSLVALERVLAAIKGKTDRGQPVPTLGDANDYRYFRTRFTASAPEEDGFLYISDACMRRFLGPETQLIELRRQIAHTHLRMLACAVQMYKVEQGKTPTSLADLIQFDCCPGTFNQKELRCPCGGEYSLAPDGTPRSSVFGSANFLKPCCEIPLAKITGEEADLYKKFIETLNGTWDEMFAPIALRLQTGKRLRLECLLPTGREENLISKSRLFHGPVSSLDHLPLPKRNLFTFAAGLDRKTLTGDLDKRLARAEAQKSFSDFMEPPFDPNDFRVGFRGVRKNRIIILDDDDKSAIDISDKQFAMLVAGCTHPGLPTQLPWPVLLQRIMLEDKDEVAEFIRDLESSAEGKQLQLRRLATQGLEWQIGVHTYDMALLFDMNWAELFGGFIRPSSGARDRNDLGGLVMMGAIQGGLVLPPLVTPLYVSVPVRDAKVVDDFLARLDRYLPKEIKKSMGGMVKTDYYHLTTKGGVAARAIGIHAGPARIRLFLARIGNGLYLANQPGILDDVKAAHDLGVKGRPAAGPQAHAMIRLRPAAWNQAKAGFHLGWAEVHRDCCLANLGSLQGTALAALASGPKSQSWDDRAKTILADANQLHGTKFYCPDGGRYVLGKDGKTMECSLHGSTLAPRQTATFAPGSDLANLLNNLTDVQATLTFQPDGLRLILLIDRQ